MDVAPRVDQLLAKAVDEQLSEQRLIREALENLEERLEQVEVSTVALEEKINPWSDLGAATADLAVRVEKRFTKRLGVLQARIDDMADAGEKPAAEAKTAHVGGAGP